MKLEVSVSTSDRESETMDYERLQMRVFNRSSVAHQVKRRVEFTLRILENPKSTCLQNHLVY